MLKGFYHGSLYHVSLIPCLCITVRRRSDACLLNPSCHHASVPLNVPPTGHSPQPYTTTVPPPPRRTPPPNTHLIPQAPKLTLLFTNWRTPLWSVAPPWSLASHTPTCLASPSTRRASPGRAARRRRWSLGSPSDPCTCAKRKGRSGGGGEDRDTREEGQLVRRVWVGGLLRCIMNHVTMYSSTHVTRRDDCFPTYCSMSFSVRNVQALPVFPARPVRPMRWQYLRRRDGEGMEKGWRRDEREIHGR